MEIDATDIAHLSGRELGELIRDLTVEIAAFQGQVEQDAGARKRTWRLVRSTILMTGGFFGAAVDLWALTLAALGIWDWIDSVSEDAVLTNRQLAISRRLSDLEFKLATATLELRKRKRADSNSE